jgi:hypothetical protein
MNRRALFRVMPSGLFTASPVARDYAELLRSLTLRADEVLE